MAASAIAVSQTAAIVSLAALVFGGQTSQLFVRGAIAFLLTSAVSNIVVSFRTSLDPVVIGLPNTIAVVVAAAVTGISSPDPATVFVFLGTVSFITGATFYLLGKAHGGQIVRFLPYPVLTAYVGGISWLLVQGGFKLMRNTDTDVTSLLDRQFWQDWKFWTAGLALTVLLGTAQQRKWPPVSQSALIIGSTVGFFMVALPLASLSDIESNGWLIGERNTGAAGAQWQPLTPDAFASADLDSLQRALPALLATVFIAFTGVLLNSSSLALTQNKRDNPNNELRAIGLANMASSVLGGLPTHHLGAATVQASGLQARGKRFSLATAAALVLVVVVAGDWLSLFPRPVAGGVLASLGVGLFPEWKRQGFDNASTIDRVLGIAIIATMVAFGVLAGIAAGIVAAIIIFVVRYSRIGPIKRTLDSRTFRSNVDRRSAENRILDDHAGSTWALMLHGYLFFGSVKQIEDAIYDRLEHEEGLKYLVLGFRDVTGLGPSAVSAFTAINKLARSRGVHVVWSGARGAPWAEPYGVAFGATVVHQPDLDRAMAWCEDQTLAAHSEELPPSVMGESSGALRRVFTSFGTERRVEEGESLIHLGEDADSVFFVVDGSLTAWLERDGQLLARFRQVAPGSLIGEVAFATGQRRTATVIANTPSTVLELTTDGMADATAQDPTMTAEFNAYMLKRVAERLAATNETVAELLRGEG